ncbi:MAG: PadR family transcriptional regulator [Thermodesulfobacteriota bacterium]
MALRYSILGLLHYQDMHGYQIKKHIEKHFGFMWSINYGQIYPNLKKMEEDGLITLKSTAKADSKRPERKLYSITPKGRAEFKTWLNSLPERNMLLRDPFLMRFVFFGFGDPRRAWLIVDEQIKSYEKQLKTRRENLRKWRKLDIYVHLMAELGLTLNEVFLDWLKKAQAEIANKIDGTKPVPPSTEERADT